ncbi:MAG TPA: EamA family transporter [Polyangiaceae bacterium]|nr:EamA family transporter [Polyangiaceae bacterium]
MKRGTISSGVVLAVAAAVAFGSTTPFVHRFGMGVGPLMTACLLYSGAALMGILWRGRPGIEARVGRSHLPRILLVAMAGAVIAPTALAWGLQRADATSASLLLNFEAIATVLLARLFFDEAIGRRIWMAVLLMLVAGAILVPASARAATSTPWGLAAVMVATLAWAVDNTLTRPLSDLDPMGIIVRKASFGASFTAGLALAFHEPLPPMTNAAVLLVCGATGYGLSLRLYLLAQRRLGVARTGSVFAVAPFIGAAGAWMLGDGRVNGATVLAGVLFAGAVYLHLSEQHAHEHTHEPIEHDHAHRHDDGHHGHAHEAPVAGVHSHSHHHDQTTHAHDHAPDVHHEHAH